MLENIRLSFGGIWSHKMRSFLTMLGIIIGIAAIIAIVSTIKGTNDQIEANLIGSGSNNVRITLQKDGYELDLSYEEVPNGVTEISNEAIEEIRSIEHVEKASRYKSRQEYDGVYHLNNSLSGGKIVGADEVYLDACDYSVIKGRGFSENDFMKAKKVALIDDKAKKALFQGDEAVGKTIEIKGEPYVVIGEIAESDSYEVVINSIEDYYMYSDMEAGGTVVVPNVTWPAIYRYDEPDNLIVKADKTDNMASAGKSAADILNTYINSDDDTVKYKAENLLEQAKQIQQLSQSTNMMLICIAGISLLVGGIGVMNIMLVSVTERTSEIGLKKAIGAGKGAILGQFLTEAVVLTCMGGIIGVIVGIFLSKVISAFMGIPTSISFFAAVFSVIFSMAIGIIFGMLPSYKAANLNPIDALRHE